MRNKQAFSFLIFLITGATILNGDTKYIKEIIKYDHEGMYIESQVYEYDGNNNCIKKEYFYHEDGLRYYETFEYENNNLARLLFYYADGRLVNYQTYEYDKKGNLVKENFYTIREDNTGLNCYYVYKYNRKNQLVKSESRDNKGRRDSYTIYVYNSRGNLIRQKQFHNHRLMEKMIYEYNEKNQKISARQIPGKHVKDGRSSSIFTYNEEGLLITITIYSAWYSDRYIYEYDEAGYKIKESYYLLDYDNINEKKI